MATKWKNFTRSSWVKAAVWTLSLVLAGVMAWQAASFAIYVTQNEITVMDAEMLASEKLSPSYLARELYFPAHDLMYRASLGSEEAIRNGDTLDEIDIYWSIYNEFENCDFDDTRTRYPADADDAYYLTDEKIGDILTSLLQTQSYELDYEASFTSWLKDNRGAYAYFRQQAINDKLQEYRECNSYTYDELDYYVHNETTGITQTNLPDAAKAVSRLTAANSGYDLVCCITGDQVQFLHCSAGSEVEKQLNREFVDYVDDRFGDSAKNVSYVAMKPNHLRALQLEWQSNRSELMQLIVVEAVCAVLFLFCLLLLCFGAGRRQDSEEAYLIRFDRIWSEVLYSVYWTLFALWCAGIAAVADRWTYLSDGMRYAILIGSTVLLAAVSLVFLLSQLRRIKARQWMNGWVIWIVFRSTFHRFVLRSGKWLYEQVQRSPLRRIVIGFAIAVPAVLVLLFAAVLLLSGSSDAASVICLFALIALSVGMMLCGIRAVDRFETIVQASADIRAGKPDTHITLHGGSSEINALAENLNRISEGLTEAVSAAVKSERLKSELISNVSHDIKTPLTSIITYIDLLKKCELDDPTVQEYLSVLEQKAQRLRILTTDLFDASKATSGAMKLELVRMDFDALLRQALGERSEHIEKAGLDVRIRSKAAAYVLADGRLLWRILDNLISNCTRYAVPHSRVYVILAPEGDCVTLTMKNISAAELNISAEELMQRFTRGDRSRHTEGSGLGLSIAQSLAELMGGHCHVEIDGDLFKAVVSIPKADDAAPVQPE